MDGHRKQKRYTPVLALILPGQKEKLKRAIDCGKGSSISFIKTDRSSTTDGRKKKSILDNDASGEYGTLLLTPSQLRKVNSSVKGT